MFKRVNIQAAEGLERLDSRCERPRAPSIGLVTQAPTCEEENSESTGERGGGNCRRFAMYEGGNTAGGTSDGGTASRPSITVSTAGVNPSTIQTWYPW